MKTKKNIKSIIIDLSNKDKLSDKEFKNAKQLIFEQSNHFTNNLFVILDNIKYHGLPLSTSICDYTDTFSLILIDEIIWLIYSNKSKYFSNSFKSILWFTHKQDYDFNKDLLRVKHIWKDVEWGKREGNYHPLGKDPGNVWLKEYSKNGVITRHECFTANEVYSKLIISQIKNKEELFEIYSTEKNNIDLAEIKNNVKDKTKIIPTVQFYFIQ